MAIGGDQGGSIRMPAVVLRHLRHEADPRPGAVHRHHADRADDRPHRADDGDVADNALLLEVLAGPDGLDPRQSTSTIDAYTAALDRGVAGMRIGLVTEGFGQPESERDVDQKVREAAERLRGLGATVEDVSIPMHLDGGAIWTPIGSRASTRQMMHGNGSAQSGKGFT